MVTFRKVTDPDAEIVEVELLNGTVAAFPATDKDPESGQRWCDRYAAKYAKFKKASEPEKDDKRAVGDFTNEIEADHAASRSAATLPKAKAHK